MIPHSQSTSLRDNTIPVFLCLCMDLHLTATHTLREYGKHRPLSWIIHANMEAHLQGCRFTMMGEPASNNTVVGNAAHEIE